MANILAGNGIQVSENSAGNLVITNTGTSNGNSNGNGGSGNGNLSDYTLLSELPERVQDIVGAFITGGAGVQVVYDDTNNTFSIVNSAPLSTENVQDIVGAMVTAGTNVNANYNDAAGTLTISATGDGTGLSAEDVQDMVAALLQAGTNVSLNYNDAANTLTITAAGTNPNANAVYLAGGTYGKPTASAVVLRSLGAAYSLPAGLATSRAVAGVAATASTVFTLAKDGVTFGTLTFAANATSGTFAAASVTSFGANNLVTLTAPASPDATLSDLTIMLTGSLA